MCSSGDSQLKSNELLSADFAQTLRTSFSTAFKSTQTMLNNVGSRLTQMISNPHGFDPKTLASMRTSSTDATATNFSQAAAKANAFNAARGGANLGSGVAAQVSGSIAAEGAQTEADQQNRISVANGQLQDENYWKGISGLTNVAAVENPNQYAGSSNQATDTSTSSGQAFLSSQQADWQNAMGVVSGVAGLASAAIPGVGMLKAAGKAAAPAAGG